MGARGPKPEAELNIIRPVDFASDRAAAPKGMTARAKVLWGDITKSLPPAWFRPSDLPLLRAYCEAAALNEKAAAKIARYGAVVKTQFTEKASPWVSVQTQSANTMSQLATKLRLCVNARISERKADTEGRPQPPTSRAGLMFGGS